MFDVQHIVVLGSIARTHNEDIDLAADICGELDEQGYKLYHAGLAPFDMLLSRRVYMQYVGRTPEKEYGTRFLTKHPPELYEEAEALLVFPKDEDILECSWLVELAVEDGMTVIGVTREGECVYGADL